MNKSIADPEADRKPKGYFKMMRYPKNFHLFLTAFAVDIVPR